MTAICIVAVGIGLDQGESIHRQEDEHGQKDQEEKLNQQADSLVVSSQGAGECSPDEMGVDYDLYFIPPASAVGAPEDRDDLIISFDLYNFDPGDSSSGEMALDSIIVDTMDLSTLGSGTPVFTYTFDAGTQGWTETSLPQFTAPLFQHAGGAGF